MLTNKAAFSMAGIVCVKIKTQVNIHIFSLYTFFHFHVHLRDPGLLMVKFNYIWWDLKSINGKLFQYYFTLEN
jgi:hypothetical protein